MSFWGLLAALGFASVVTIAIRQTREIAKDAALAPESWEEGGADANAFQNYRSFSQLARGAGYPELYYAHEPIVQMLHGQSDDGIMELCESINASQRF